MSVRKIHMGDVMVNEFKVPIISGRGWGGLPKRSRTLYESRYFKDGEDYETWLDRVCRQYSDSREHRGRIKQYIRNHWFHPATPVSANAGLPSHGFPVSCFVQHVGDNKDSIMQTWFNGFHLGARGAGIGRYWGDVRSAGEKVGIYGKSSGIIPFLKVDEAMTLAVSQGGLRRASEAAWLPIWHPEIDEFISLRDPSGDIYRRTHKLFTGVVIDDKFMKAVNDRASYDLISPKTGEVIKTVDAFDLWTKLLDQRMLRGAPFILFVDTVNQNRPDLYVQDDKFVFTSNLCSEITLHTNPNYDAICVLSSINLEHYDEFSSPEIFDLFLLDVHRFVDNVLSDFIANAEGEKGFENAVKSAEYERSIGIGVMGFHNLLMSKMLPFDSVAAFQLNKNIFARMRQRFKETNELLAKEKGACPLAAKHDKMQRNTHVTAIAPTASISTLCGGTSQGIDPIITNIYAHKTNAYTEIVKNRYLVNLLQSKNMDTDDVWASIRANAGSVQHLDGLTDEEKAVFKTAYEIPQEAIIELAAERQKYIDQSQSVNLFIMPPVNADYLHAIHLFAWAKGLKSLYYIRSDQPIKVGNLNDMRRADEMITTMSGTDRNFEECIYCG